MRPRLPGASAWLEAILRFSIAATNSVEPSGRPVGSLRLERLKCVLVGPRPRRVRQDAARSSSGRTPTSLASRPARWRSGVAEPLTQPLFCQEAKRLPSAPPDPCSRRGRARFAGRLRRALTPPRGSDDAASERRRHPKGRSEAEEARERIDDDGPTWPAQAGARAPFSRAGEGG